MDRKLFSSLNATCSETCSFLFLSSQTFEWSQTRHSRHDGESVEILPQKSTVGWHDDTWDTAIHWRWDTAEKRGHCYITHCEKLAPSFPKLTRRPLQHLNWLSLHLHTQTCLHTHTHTHTHLAYNVVLVLHHFVSPRSTSYMTTASLLPVWDRESVDLSRESYCRNTKWLAVLQCKYY